MGNYVIDILTSEDMENTPLESRFRMNFTSGLFSTKTLVYIIKLRIDVSKASQGLLENFVPFLLGSFHSKQKFKVSLEKAAGNVNCFAV